MSLTNCKKLDDGACQEEEGVQTWPTKA
jgi:hypothetical protein